MNRFRWGGRRGLVLRLILYAVAAGALFLARNSVDWKRPRTPAPPPAGESRTLTLSGDALAPGLVADILAFYRRDNPGLDIRLLGSGSSAALEDVANGRADAAFTLRPASDTEQHEIVSLRGDSLLAFPVAIGGFLLLAGADAPLGSLSRDDLGAFLAGTAEAPFDRLYAPDPNAGEWPAFLALFGGTSGPRDSGRIVFLERSEDVVRAVAGDAGAVGIVGALSLSIPDPSVRIVPLRGEASNAPMIEPTGENIASGMYSLYYTLYIASLSKGGTEGARFVTHLNSARGQRQIERTAFLPARREPRKVEITRGAPGGPG